MMELPILFIVLGMIIASVIPTDFREYVRKWRVSCKYGFTFFRDIVETERASNDAGAEKIELPADSTQQMKKEKISRVLAGFVRETTWRKSAKPVCKQVEDNFFVIYWKRFNLVSPLHTNLMVDPSVDRIKIVVKVNRAFSGLSLGIACFLVWFGLTAAVPCILGAIICCRKYFREVDNTKLLAGLLLENVLNKSDFETLLDDVLNRGERVREVIQKAMEGTENEARARCLDMALGDSCSDVRKAAANLLGVIGDKHSVKPLAGVLGNAAGKEIGDRAAAAEALGFIGDEAAVPALAEAAEHKNPALSRTAVSAIGLIGKYGAVEPLVIALKNDDSCIRETAARSLGKIGHKHAVEPLIDALNDDDHNVSRAAARSLGNINDPRAVEPLFVSVGKGEINSQAAIALAKFGYARSVDPLIDVLNDPFLRGTLAKEAEKAFDRLIQANKTFYHMRHSLLFCRRCMRRGVEILAYSILYKQTSGSIIFCKNCHNAVSFLAGIRKVVGVIGGDPETFKQNKETVTVSLWDERTKSARYADIDSLVVRGSGVENYDFAINALILELAADASASEKLKAIPVSLEMNPALSTMALGLLRDNFMFED